MDRKQRDKALIDTALAELDAMALPDLSAQGKEVGTSGETVRKWRTGETTSLIRKSRPGVEAFLRRRGREPDNLVVSRETASVPALPAVLAQKAAAWDVVAGLAELVRGAGTDAGLGPLVDDMLRKVREQFRAPGEEGQGTGDRKVQ